MGEYNMNKGKLLGYTSVSWNKDSDHSEDRPHDTGETNYKFYIEYNNLIYSFSAKSSYGSCGSGWCSASWGYINNELDIEKWLNTDNITKTNKDVYINISEDMKVVTTILDPDEEHYDDATTAAIISTERVVILSSTGNGGCSYYPSGVLMVNELLFE